MNDNDKVGISGTARGLLCCLTYFENEALYHLRIYVCQLPYLVKNVLKLASVGAVSTRTHYDQLRIHIRVVFFIQTPQKMPNSYKPKNFVFSQKVRENRYAKEADFYPIIRTSQVDLSSVIWDNTRLGRANIFEVACHNDFRKILDTI